CSVRVFEESYSDGVDFDSELRTRMAGALGGVPALATGAGHDAAILASRVPAGMLYVRNPTGISHAPEEVAEAVDVEHGAAALAAVLVRFATGRLTGVNTRGSTAGCTTGYVSMWRAAGSPRWRLVLRGRGRFCGV